MELYICPRRTRNRLRWSRILRQRKIQDPLLKILCPTHPPPRFYPLLCLPPTLYVYRWGGGGRCIVYLYLSKSQHPWSRTSFLLLHCVHLINQRPGAYWEIRLGGGANQGVLKWGTQIIPYFFPLPLLFQILVAGHRALPPPPYKIDFFI